MRLKVFRISNLLLNIFSDIIAIAIFIISIIFNDGQFLTPLGCGFAVVIITILLVMSIKNFNKNTCILIDLAFEKNMTINMTAFCGSIVILVLGVLALIGGIIVIFLTNLFSLGLPLIALGNFIIFNIISYFVYMYVEMHY